MSTTLHLFSVSVLLLSSAAAQTTYSWSPPNTASVSGGSNNTIPYWGMSSTYQQIHDQPTLGAAPLLTIKGMGMRPAGNRTVRGRAWDMRITLSHTKVTSASATSTFSTNLGSGNTTMVFGTPTTWPTFSWRDFTTSGTTPAYTIPFKAPYLYLSSLGNLAWEWRWKNGTSVVNMAMDASAGNQQRGTVLPSIGTGCIASGKSLSAVAKIASRQLSTFQYDLEVRLSNGANSASAMMALGLSGATSSIGWCAPVITPVLLLPVTTDATGTFVLHESIAKLSGTAPFNLYAQFGFSDTGLPGLLGLSDVAGWTSPKVPGANGLVRLYSYNRTSNGSETATTASGKTHGYGLSVAWMQ